MTNDITEELSQLTVGELLRRFPLTVRVFLDHRMNCPVCPIAPFMTVDEAAGEYGVDAAQLRRDIARVVADAEPLQ